METRALKEKERQKIIRSNKKTQEKLAAKAKKEEAYRVSANREAVDKCLDYTEGQMKHNGKLQKLKDVEIIGKPIDENKFIERHTVFTLSTMLEEDGGGRYNRTVSMMNTFKNISETLKSNYHGPSQSKRQEVAQKAFSDFSKLHGNVVNVKEDILRAEDSLSTQILQQRYTFKLEKGYTPQITFLWSNSNDNKFYKLVTVEWHVKY
jgi:hypothetical protein